MDVCLYVSSLVEIIVDAPDEATRILSLTKRLDFLRAMTTSNNCKFLFQGWCENVWFDSRWWKIKDGWIGLDAGPKMCDLLRQGLRIMFFNGPACRCLYNQAIRWLCTFWRKLPGSQRQVVSHLLLEEGTRLAPWKSLERSKPSRPVH